MFATFPGCLPHFTDNNEENEERKSELALNISVSAKLLLDLRKFLILTGDSHIDMEARLTCFIQGYE